MRVDVLGFPAESGVSSASTDDGRGGMQAEVRRRALRRTAAVVAAACALGFAAVAARADDLPGADDGTAVAGDRVMPLEGGTADHPRSRLATLEPTFSALVETGEPVRLEVVGLDQYGDPLGPVAGMRVSSSVESDVVVGRSVVFLRPGLRDVELVHTASGRATRVTMFVRDRPVGSWPAQPCAAVDAGFDRYAAIVGRRPAAKFAATCVP
ncbi:hypothetical protein [Agromyces seonyuensis]|uniref:Uncharacterized protein n=1 Tax=Agromyces seonyuensis TaxID=2662446 RepID=A0A6I4NXS1_9MICO|nr:hypothetical protein [Agromyces seonyuensis]MWB97315.1 hypothetical protein [Agromyces seonyuensis]